MVTLRRLEKRNQEFFSVLSKNPGREWEKFGLLLRKKTRSKKIMTKRLTESIRNLENIEKKQVILRVLSTIRAFGNNEEVVAAGVLKLVEIFTRKSDFFEFWENGVFDLCLWVVDTKHSDELLEAGTELLANLSVGNSCYCEEMAQKGIIEKIFGVIEKNLQITDNCLWALNNLLNGSVYILSKILFSDPFLNTLFNLAHNQKIGKKTKILFVLAQICNSQQLNSYHSESIFQIFLSYLNQEWATTSCILGLSTLCTNQKLYLRKIYEIFPNIFEKLISYSDKSEILDSLKFLSNFSFFEDFTQVLLNNKILPFLRRVLGCKIQGAKKAGFFILSNLLNSEEQYFCTVVADKELINLLISCVNEQNCEIKFEVWVCLKILCNRTVFYYGGIFDNLIYYMHSAFEVERDVRVLMEMLETYEAVLRNAGEMLENVQELMNETQCFEAMVRNRCHKNKEVADKVEFIIDQYYNRELLHGIEDSEIIDYDF